MIPREQQRGRSWIFMVLALLLASATALAGTTANLTGFVRGPNDQPLAGAKVTVTSAVLQGPRTATTDSQGFFRLTQLPPGDGYRVKFEASGYKTTERSGIVLHIDETIKLPTVRMSQQQTVDVVEVVEEAPVVEQGSTTIGRTLTSEFLNVVPSQRNTTAILQMAPGAATDAIGTTFRGASSPENSYVVDGLNTTGVLLGLDTSALPPEFIQEIQVKTGGYEPEYGRATGGQAIVITKSGGNEFHGDVFAYANVFEGRRHSVVRGPYTDVPADPATGASAQSVWQPAGKLLAQVGFDLGGYIIKDKLWFFVGYAPEYRKVTFGHEWRVLGAATVDDNGIASYSPEQLDPDLTENAVYDLQTRLSNFYIANLTFNINQNNSVRLGASGNPRTLEGVQLTNNFFAPGVYMGKNTAGAMDFSLVYNGKFADGLVNLDTIVGYHTESDVDYPFEGEYNSDQGDTEYNGQTIDGTGAQYQARTNFNLGDPCYDIDGNALANPCYASGASVRYLYGGFGGLNRTAANRFVIKPILSVFVNNMVGNHVFKVGGDMERNHVVNKRGFTGGAFVEDFSNRWRARYYSNFGEPITWHGIDDDASYFVTETNTQNFSAFVQDNWSILSNLQLNLGVRWEMQSIRDTKDIPRIVIPDMIAPRIGLIFDFTKEGRSKLFANFGRYYESIPQDINDRALSAEGFNRYTFSKAEEGYADSFDPANETVDSLSGRTAENLGGEISPVQVGLKGQYSDQFLLGFEYEVMKDLSAGVTGVYNYLGNVIEDISPDNGNTYLIANPGADHFDYYESPEPDADGNLPEPKAAGVDFRRCIASTDPLTGAPTTYCFPKATRAYRGLEFNVNKRFTNNWTAQASYTLSQTYGNYPGLFAQSRGQLDPNITSQFDLPNLLVNRNGFLDTDRRHLMKFAGAYQFNFGTSFGLTANIQSGIPILYLGAHPVYGAGEAFLLPRNQVPTDSADWTLPTDSNRTPWILNLDANVRHELTFKNKKKLALGLQVNNLLNGQNALRVDQSFTVDVTNPSAGATALAETVCYSSADYTVKSACTKNANVGNPVEFQAPLTVRLEAKFSF